MPNLPLDLGRPDAFGAGLRSRRVFLQTAGGAFGAFCASLAGPAAWAATIDISPKLTGVIFGIMNMAGNIGAYVCPVTVGKVMDHIEATAGDWNLVLYLFVGVNLACALCWLFLNPNRPVVE